MKDSMDIKQKISRLLADKRTVEYQFGFTLIEVLIVMSILAVLSTFTVLVLNPAQILAENRDFTRLNDIKVLDNAIKLSKARGSIVDSTFEKIVYISLLDTDNDTAEDCKLDYSDLPTLASGWIYRCAVSKDGSANLRNVNSTGWLPINFNIIPDIQPPLNLLPIDPDNNVNSYYAYGYDLNKKDYAITSIMLSDKYRGGIALTDGGNWNIAYETRPITWKAWDCGDLLTFTYKGGSVTYGTVNSVGGKCWLDRNLGAMQVAVAYDDSVSYGDLFQWGRLDDGHQTRTSGTTAILSATDDPGHGNFITTGFPNNWRNPQNDNLWQGVSGVNNPCPSGWRLPVYSEWDNERASWSEQNYNGAFASPLKLTVAGLRNYSAGFDDVGSIGDYWASDVSGPDNASRLVILAGFATMSSYPRGVGLSVRCIKN
jgi:prepilin-type N-terminal cleavage/methylation domain-containing protein/uncharacterized protein (TIGR02145 family)